MMRKWILTYLFVWICGGALGAPRSVIHIRNRQDFDLLQEKLDKAVFGGAEDISVVFTPGDYYFRHNHIKIYGKDWKNVRLTLSGNGARLLAEGPDLQAGDPWDGSAPLESHLVTLDGGWIDFFGPVMQATGPVGIVDASQKLCRIRCPSGFQAPGQTDGDAFIQLTRWYESRFYKISQIRGRWIYFVADDLEKVSSLGYNVNYDLLYGRKNPRFRLCNVSGTAAGISSGKLRLPAGSGKVHCCKAATFLSIHGSNLGAIVLDGFQFLGNAAIGDCPLIGVYHCSCSEGFKLKDCRFSYKYLHMPAIGQSEVKVASQGTLPSPDLKPGDKGYVDIPKGKGDVLQVTATDPFGQEIFTWSHPLKQASGMCTLPTAATMTESADDITVTTANKTYVFSKKDGHLQKVGIGSRTISLSNGPRFIAVKRSDRSQDGFFNHDDKEAFKKKTQYTTYDDQGSFAGFNFEDGQLTAKYDHGSLTQVVWKFHEDGSIHFTANCLFNGVVDMMGVTFDYPETQVKSKQWVGNGPYRVWQNRLEGPQYGYWQTDYNDPIPGESFEYPEFKGYFSHVRWMQLNTAEGKIGIQPTLPRSGDKLYVGVYQPRDGRDHLLYELPATGLSLFEAIPAVRNKVNTTDLNGPSAQPYWATGMHVYSAELRFE